LKHLIGYLIFIVLALASAHFFKQQKEVDSDNRPTVRIYGSSSFVGSWGPGPVLKEAFEADCNCRVELFDTADTAVLLQRMQSDAANTVADLIVGFDQFDIEKAEKAVSWKKLNLANQELDPNIVQFSSGIYFVPYDYAPIAVNFKISETPDLPRSFDDLLDAKFKRRISLQDPRTSSPGLQFLLWLVKVKGEDGAFEYLAKLSSNIHSISPSWSTSYGLFQKGQAKATVSYGTSPIYHLIEEKNSDYRAAEFNEGHPIQVEFMGMPSSCRNCDLGEKFAQYILSPAGQKIIMTKNYMLPVIPSVQKGSEFENLPQLKVIDQSEIPDLLTRERIMQRWAEFRRGNGF
jgi:thiamine transport system substrate-binding protein